MAHSHDHSHSHGHHQHHVPSKITRAFIIGIILNSAFVLTEAIAGFWTHSLALLTDAGHNLSDVASLVLSLVALKLAKKKTNEVYTYGYRKTTIIVALFNAVILLVAIGAIGWEAVQRLFHPHTVEGKTISIVAGVGIAINTISALMFLREKELNARNAYLHLAADALVSLGVVIAGIIIIYTGWFWVDAIISLVIMVVILIGTWGLLRDSLRLSLDAVPGDIDLSKVRQYLEQLKGVHSIHDLHVWAMSTSETALTVHLVMPEGHDDTFYEKVQEHLHHEFNISHTTIQIERSRLDEGCHEQV
jgi:cobalt-zinc-cadmium efflux system protein